MVLPAIGTVVLLGAGGVAAAAAITGGGGGGAAPRVSATPSTSVTAVTTSPSASPSSTPTPTATTPPARPHRPPPALAIRTTGAVSWLEVTRPGGRVIFSGMLRHGHAVVVRSGPAHAVIGDAGAVRLSRHGRVSEPAGRPHAVLVVDVR